MTLEVLRTLPARLDPAHTALLVVDMQNDFCADGGYIHKTRKADMSGMPALAQRISSLVEATRARGVATVWVRANYEPRFLSPQAILKREERPGGLVCCAGGSWGWEFFEVRPHPDELVIEKHSFSGFFGTELDRLLRYRGIKTLVMTGVATNTCVESTLRDGFFLGYYIVLVEDCCASTAAHLHQATLDNVRANFGDVRTAAALKDCWR
ncbi:MAG: cysteine hydrolase [Alphaproteobacteria bacterium]|nr:cysteine hydrolase [Alphaproteobacteria bacterium]